MPDPSLEVENLRRSLFSAKIENGHGAVGDGQSLVTSNPAACSMRVARAVMMGGAKDLCAYKRYTLNNEC